MSHKADMPYTNAFIQELYRFRTLTPLGVPHKTNTDTELDGYVIPKGSQVLHSRFNALFFTINCLGHFVR